MASAETIVAIKDGPTNPAVKVARVLSYPDGGVGVFVAYHPIKNGVIAKIRLGPELAEGGGLGKILESHRVPGLVKLSIHPSGFAQFSSAGSKPIRSGVGRLMVAKGVGLQCQNLLLPIDTGPTFLIETHDISQFARLRPQREAPCSTLR